MTDEELKALDLEALNGLLKPVFKAEEGDYAKLADENDEQGMVNVYRKSGALVMQMPRDVWDKCREGKAT